METPSEGRVRGWLETLGGFGPRLTGSPQHQAFLRFLEAELTALGLDVRRDRIPLLRWQAGRVELSAAGPSGWEALPVSSPLPYSGRTGADGVEGEVVYYRRAPLSFRRAAGKIAVVDVHVHVVPRILVSRFLRPRAGKSGGAENFPQRFTGPILAVARLPCLDRAARAGVRGVVCVWRNCSDDNAAYQYLPFTEPLGDCPALWVGARIGDRLRELKGAVRLRLEASIDRQAQTETLFAVLPGEDAKETIIVNTHTDGPNACEENGAIGLLALARHFSGLKRRRTFVFAFVTGHFQLPQMPSPGQATRSWLHAHPELWDGKPGHARAVAGLTLEHMGAMEWKDDQAGRFRPTHAQEVEFIYAANETLADIYRESARGRTMARQVLLRPMTDIYFGEGQPLFQEGVPTLSLIPIPDYLFAASPGGGIEKLNAGLMAQQIATFAAALGRIDETPAADLAAREPEPGRLLQALVRWSGIFDWHRRCR
jgi:hypothetical protein